MRCAPVLGRSLALVLTLVLPILASAQTLERIENSDTFRIGFVSDQPPFSSAATDQPAEGYSVELCRKVAEQLNTRRGLHGLTISYTPTTVADGLEMVENGDVDILCGAVTHTLQRRERVSFSIPIFTSGIGVLLREDAPYRLVQVLKGEVPYTGPRWRATINRGLVNHVYAVHAGTTGENWVRAQIASLGVIARVVTVNEHDEGVDMVANGKADAYFADRVILERYASQHKAHDELMVLDRYFDYEPLALVVARGDEDFRLLVDTTLSRLYGSDDFVGLYTRYFGAPSDMTRTLFKTYALP
jgi:polar amino acid transport system substrate-binding protein